MDSAIHTWGTFGWKYACGDCIGATAGLNITGWCPVKEGPICRKKNTHTQTKVSDSSRRKLRQTAEKRKNIDNKNRDYHTRK